MDVCSLDICIGASEGVFRGFDSVPTTCGFLSWLFYFFFVRILLLSCLFFLICLSTCSFLFVPFNRLSSASLSLLLIAFVCRFLVSLSLSVVFFSHYVIFSNSLRLSFSLCISVCRRLSLPLPYLSHCWCRCLSLTTCGFLSLSPSAVFSSLFPCATRERLLLKIMILWKSPWDLALLFRMGNFVHKYYQWNYTYTTMAYNIICVLSCRR